MTGNVRYLAHTHPLCLFTFVYNLSFTMYKFVYQQAQKVLWNRIVISYLLSPWSRVLLEKLTGPLLVKKFPAFYGTRRFITVFTSAGHLSLSWTRSILPMPPPNPTSSRSVLILSSHLRLGPRSCLLPWGFPTKTLYTPFLSTYVLHVPPISFFSIWSPE